jgi:hypothetical protein
MYNSSGKGEIEIEGGTFYYYHKNEIGEGEER